MATKHAPNLPPELLREILKDLSLKDLCVASLISKNFVCASQELLFRNGPCSKNEMIHWKFLDSIDRTPALARFVRRYVQVISVDSFPRIRKLRYTLTHKLVPLMVNLKHFEYKEWSNEFEADPTFLGNCSFQLEAFGWGTQGQSEITFIVEKFLPLQASLKHLALWITHPIYLKNAACLQSAVSGACPLLESLSGLRGTMELFLPGRNMKCVQWITHKSDRGSQNIAQLAEHLRKVECLSWGGKHRKNLLNQISPFLRSVKVLHMASTNTKLFHQTMEQFPRLKTLIMSVDIIPDSCQTTLRNIQDLDGALGKCTKLRNFFVVECDDLTGAGKAIGHIDRTKSAMTGKYIKSLPALETFSKGCVLWDQTSLRVVRPIDPTKFLSNL